MELTRKQCNELRGLAILSIMFHNFLHQERFLFAQENESSFDLSRTMDFIHGLGQGWGHAICEVGSFLGWIGVPVFVFLSGYGLVCKYESTSSKRIAPLSYVSHSWLKLLKLMLPGILFFAIYLELRGFGGFGVWARYGLYLSMLNNFFGLPPLTPGVYWYFGLTFELYLVYLLFYKFRSRSLLVLGIVAPLILQALVLFLGDHRMGYYILNNFIGWLPIFCIGMIVGRMNLRASVLRAFKRGGVIGAGIMSIISGVLLVLVNFSPYAWLTIHFIAVAFFIALVCLIDKIPALASFLSWVGTISSLIFVCHPIARILINDIYGGRVSLALELGSYVLLTRLLVFMLKHILRMENLILRK